MVMKPVGSRRVRLWASGLAFIAGAFSALASFAQEQEPARRTEAVVLTIDGPVTPANAQYVAREIGKASDAGKELVVLEIDTPGGLVDSMKTIIKAMLASETPIATFVSPQGARSASAGLYIMYAAQISAMAPNTNTGAATPVELGGGRSDENPFEDETKKPAPGAIEEPAPAEGGAPADTPEEPRSDAPASAEDAPALGNDDAMRAKIINDSVAYIRSLAEEHGRNADWAEKAVREAASVTSREALELGVIDLIAEDLDDLLAKIDGRVVKTPTGEKTLSTANIAIERVAPILIERILGFIANPNVAVILMSLATTGIIIEMWNPGSIFPGALGVTCLLLGLYALQVLPYNWLPLALMGVGAILIAVEAYTPTFGLAGLSGLALLGAGMYFLFPEGFRISNALIATIIGSVGVILAFILAAVVSSRSHGPMIGAEAIRRREGVVDEWNGKEGWVVVEGERWRARADRPLEKGDKIRVVEVDGLVLIVKQAKSSGLLSAFAPAA
jgi:membrane-bound serine protease (ClpP class)